jgi:hypothetical protein
VEACNNVLDLLKRLGATTVPIRLPELDTIRVAHGVTFFSECYALQRKFWADDETRAQVRGAARRAAWGRGMAWAYPYSRLHQVRP